MALAFAKPPHFQNQPQHIGQMVILMGDLTFDSSYPTGGEPLLPSTVGMNTIDGVFFTGATGRDFQWDRTNNKILAYSTAATEVSNAADLSAVVVGVLIIGT